MRKLFFTIVALLLCTVGAWADTSKLLTTDGWSKITTMPSSTDIANNYYVFVDNERDLMLGTGKGVEQNKTWYSLGVYYYTSVSPTSSSINNMVWTLEKINSYGDNGFALRNLENSVLCFQAESDGAWKYDTNDVTSPNEWAQVIFSYADGSWTLQNGKFGGTNYIGPWSDSNFTNGAECAANKSGNNVGHFQIYAISRAQFKQNLMDAASSSNPVDLTPWYVTNATFDANNSDGWTIDFSANSSSWWGSHAFSNLGAENYLQVAEVHQNLTLPNGKYKVALQGASNKVSENQAYVFATHNGSTEKTFFTQSTVNSPDEAKWSNMQYNLLLMMQNRSYGQVQTPEVTVTTGSLTIGYKNESGHSWDVYDNFKLYYTGAYVSHVATSFTNGTAATADQWYKVTVSAGEYVVKDTVASTIYWTQDGEKYVNDNDFSSFSLGAGESKILTLTAGTFYFKSNATGKAYVTKIDETNLSGWTRVEDLATLQTNTKDYFYAIFSAETSNLLVRTNTSNGEPYYLTGTNPISNAEYMYEIENYTYSSDSYFVMKSLATNAYYYITSGSAYDLKAPSSGKTTADDACRLTFDAVNGVWRIKTWEEYDDGSYLGRWYSDTKPYITGERLAGNKKASVAGSFLIYRISKDNLNMTSLITNPDFSASKWDTGWTGTGSNKAEKFADQSGNANFSGHFAEMWVPSGTTMSAGNLYQTINNLPAGVYTLSAKIQAGITCKLYAAVTGQSEQYIEYNGAVATKSLSFTVNSANNVTIGIKHDGVNKPTSDTWVAVDDFTLSYSAAISTDYAALSAAITAYDNATWGFESGEYAPYNNVTAIENITAAKAINSNSINSKSLVNSLTEALELTANVGEVDAIYDGVFANTATGDVHSGVTGWTTTGTATGDNSIFRQVVNATKFAGGKGLYFWPTTLKYGETTGYTMPLTPNSVYRLSFAYGGWESGTNSPSITLTNESGNVISSLQTGTAPLYTSGVTTYTIYFTTGASRENHTFKFTSYGNTNTVIGDFSLVKVDALTFADGSVPNYVAGTYPSVKISRTLTADRWATAVYPFAVRGVDNIAVLSSFNAGTGSIRFETATESAANEPFLMRSASNKSEITLNNIAVSATTETPTVTKNEASLIGAYNSINITKAQDNYVLFNNGIYDVGDAGATINPYRAYIQIAGGGGARSLVFFVDEETTAIEGLNSERTMPVGNIYNLNGQLVRKNADNMNGLRKGIYIVGGKRITVK